MLPVERLHAELTRRRISRTQARDNVYVALKTIGPCRPVDLVRQLRTQHNETTVYRTIKLFLNINVASRPSHGLIELTTPPRQHHHHITCPNCGKITNFFDPALDSRLEKIAVSRRLQIQAHQIEVTAICGLCQLTKLSSKPKNR